jgi:predicted transcriptional regulator of viral defense system
LVALVARAERLTRRVFSHRTALSLHELTDVTPSKLDLTVPPGFRKGTAIPSILRLHFAAVGTDECENIFGVPVTNALRTIVDVLREGRLPRPILREAFKEAARQGKLTKRQVTQARKNPVMASILDALETESK